jgi:hypothetical protein
MVPLGICVRKKLGAIKVYDSSVIHDVRESQVEACQIGGDLKTSCESSK